MKIVFILNMFFLAIVYNASADPIEECIAKSNSCVADCNQQCEMTKKKYCEEHNYSGCALDVFCWCNACNIYDTKWCPSYPDYVSCAEGAKGTYKGCIENCQSKWEAGQDVSTCWADCNAIFNAAIIVCKQGPCQEFCKEQGFSKGEWANYTYEYGWDSCYCSGDEEPEQEYINCEEKCAANGDHWTGAGRLPDCHCFCEEGYVGSEIVKECYEDCDKQCQDEYGPGARGSGDTLDCDCSCPNPSKWNEDKTRCDICDFDGKCEPDEFERCDNCIDCACTNYPYTECNTNPNKPKAPLGYEDTGGCYVKDIEQYKKEECEKWSKYIQKDIEHFIEFGNYTRERQTAWPVAGYDYLDDKIGIATDVGKFLMRLGYITPDGVENPLRVRTNPLAAMNSYINQHVEMYGNWCEKEFYQDKKTIFHDAYYKFRDSFLAILRMPSTPASPENVWINESVKVYGGNIKSTTLPNGDVLYNSTFELTVEDDLTTTINLIEGSATYTSFINGGHTDFFGGERLIINSEGNVQNPEKFDANSLDKWWEELEVVEVEAENLWGTDAYLESSDNSVGDGYNVTSELWTKAVLQVPGSPVTLIWKMVGADITPSGDQVISGYFYADPNEFAYGSLYNPEVFVKIYIGSNGWCNMAFNHVTVDDVMVYPIVA